MADVLSEVEMRGTCCAALLLVGLAGAPAAQQLPRRIAPDPSPAPGRTVAGFLPVHAPHVVRWWEAASVAGFTALVMTQDEYTTEEMVEHPTDAADHVASVFRRVGQPEIYAALPLGVITAGVVAGDPRITRAGGRLAASVAVSTAAFETLKLVVGRARPDAGEGAWSFSPFSGRGAFPSGHSAVAFALATSLSNELHNGWATAGLYAVATGTAWSRVYNQRHWASDVVLGAALGITTGNVIYGKWRIFGIRPPAFLLEPTGAGLQMRIPVRARG